MLLLLGNTQTNNHTHRDGFYVLANSRVDEEDLIYPFLSMVSDFGSISGLLIGFSLYNIISTLFKKFNEN